MNTANHGVVPMSCDRGVLAQAWAMAQQEAQRGCTEKTLSIPQAPQLPQQQQPAWLPTPPGCSRTGSWPGR